MAISLPRAVSAARCRLNLNSPHTSTGAGYHAKYPEDTPEVLTEELPIGVLGYFAYRVPMRDVNALFARPTRADMELAISDAPLRALYQRVDHVTYRVTQDLSAELKQTVQDIVREFAETLHTYLLIRAGVIQSLRRRFQQ